jgi:steroid 5-alpha reductase family enzyme
VTARFDEVRGNCLAFFGFWVYQMFWVFLCSMPVIYVNAMEGQLGRANMSPPLGVWDYLGWALFACGTLMQIVADVQKYKFRSNPENRGMFCQVGLWNWSRHPNYYGEMLIWIGAFLCVAPFFAVPNLSGAAVAAGATTILSPLFTIFVLTRLSGLPTCEGKYLSRYFKNGNGDAWEDYARRTAPIILQPQCLYYALPVCVKRAFCCEWASLAYKKELQPLGGDAESSEVRGV